MQTFSKQHTSEVSPFYYHNFKLKQFQLLVTESFAAEQWWLPINIVLEIISSKQFPSNADFLQKDPRYSFVRLLKTVNKYIPACDTEPSCPGAWLLHASFQFLIKCSLQKPKGCWSDKQQLPATIQLTKADIQIPCPPFVYFKLRVNALHAHYSNKWSLCEIIPFHQIPACSVCLAHTPSDHRKCHQQLTEKATVKSKSLYLPLCRISIGERFSAPLTSDSAFNSMGNPWQSHPGT